MGFSLVLGTNYLELEEECPQNGSSAVLKGLRKSRQSEIHLGGKSPTLIVAAKDGGCGLTDLISKI